jgi:hypothetical protein
VELREHLLHALDLDLLVGLDVAHEVADLGLRAAAGVDQLAGHRQRALVVDRHVAQEQAVERAALVNGAFVLPSALQAQASSPAAGALTDVGGAAAPTSLASWTGPISNDPVLIRFSQRIAKNDALRTGTYSKTLTFTLSTTQP